MKKRSAITAVIIMFICVAVYLNWNTMEIKDDRERLNENFGETNFVVNDSAEASETSAEENVSDKEKTEESSDTMKNSGEYFDEARMEKQKARDSAITTLKETTAEESVSQETRDKAAGSIEKISTNALAETRIETLVKAKGYVDCVALINDSGVSVIVTAPEEGLSPSDINKIKDIAVSETNILPSNIKIVEIH
ncbi:MAG: SpoIIIAH-like family protein [Oscillospiraceae bacterium]|nr:SpoIIIAH-like family protein [Oscillospiraceae bacterium]MBQ6847268.1 SpoIIIAH-like family protein [Oscillospiraceae bacterium]MBQ7120031.1 SpoIIIAH-like family protein [Oscillospiraceae bacterium]